MAYLIGYDLGSSSVKASLVAADSGQMVKTVQHPATEMEIKAPRAGWAEQDPAIWWKNICLATHQLTKNISTAEVAGIGIAYQMHGLVLLDKYGKVLRPSIIWCDSRAVKTGDCAFEELGTAYCLSNLLNSPGNFTASKLKWVRDNEPEIYEKVHWAMLPGDYLAWKMTGVAATTVTGLSEGIFWNFRKNEIAKQLLQYFQIPQSLLPPVVSVFSEQGKLTADAAQALGLPPRTPVTYRAGDQPNNALSLNVLQPGEIAATGGTSGVVYGIVDQPTYDAQSRVNSFAHVNYQPEKPRIGVLLCINGAGIQYSWLKNHMTKAGVSYKDMEKMAASVPIGAAGLRILTFGNGAERMLDNQNIGAQVNNWQFNRHRPPHFYRAGLEGIAFAFVYGVQLMKQMGLDLSVIRVGNDNLFQSAVFSNTIATLLDSTIEVVETTGAIGAAKAAGVGAGIFSSPEEAVQHAPVLMRFRAQPESAPYHEAFSQWQSDLKQILE